MTQFSDTAEKKKILIVLTSHGEFTPSHEPTGYWLSELTHFYDVLNEAGFDIDIASPRGGEPPMDPGSRAARDPINTKCLNDPSFIEKISHTLTPDQVDARMYVAVYFAGGHGPMYDLAQDERIASITRAIYENGGIVSAVCHGSAALLPVVLSSGTHVLAGKTVSGFTNTEELLVRRKKYMPFLLEDKLKSLSGKYTKGFPFLSHVVVDGRLITGQNPRSAKKVAEALKQAIKEA